MTRIQILLSGSFALTVMLSGCGNSPGYPRPEADVSRPENQLNFSALYKQNCAACHGVEGKMALQSISPILSIRRLRMTSRSGNGLVEA